MTSYAANLTYRSGVIDQSHIRPARDRRLRLPVAAGPARALVLVTVFVCAACGLVYELELIALASYLVGDTVTQASVVLSVMVFAMGVGSLLAKRLRLVAAAAFATLEAALALIGGLSVMALYASFAWLGQSRPAMTVFAFAIGVLIGAEVPLLMTLIQRIRRQDAGGAVADLFAADYVGALAGGLAFPFLLLPLLGQLTGALVTGAVNAAAGGIIVLWLFRSDLTPRARVRVLLVNVAVLAVLATAALASGPFERAARHALYGGDVTLAAQTAVQEVVVTRGPRRLYLDGRLRLSYHEALVHPAMAGPRARVLVIAGGDGIALGEVLRYADVRSATVVDSDGRLMRIARTDPGLALLNRHSFLDPRVHAVPADPFDWLRDRRGPYDVVLVDLPDPCLSRSAKLYSQEFFGLAARALDPGGRLAVHAPGDLWTLDATLRAAGLHTLPYAPGGPPTPGGLDLAAATPPHLHLPGVTFRPLRAPERDFPPSTLMRPRL